MKNILIGQGYWEYIKGEMEEMPKLLEYNPTTTKVKTFKDWTQGASKVM